MKNKALQLILTLSVLFGFQDAFSKPIDVEAAQKIAINFYKLNSGSANSTFYIAKLIYTRTEEDNTVDYFVFDIYPKGFVIIAADDAVQPILAYSNETFFESNVHNTGVKDWMDDVANNVNYIVKNNLQATKEISNKWTTYTNGQNPIDSRSSSSAGPLIKTFWNQSPYYNEYCPGGSVTGCVATTMAQIMKYWNYPIRGIGSYSYTDSPYGTLSANFGNTNYAWNSMPKSVGGGSTTTEKNAVALLMYQVGISVATQYSTAGSSSWVLEVDDPGGPSAQNSYVKYFGYNASTIMGAKKTDYTSQEWDTLIINDLNAGRPIEYEGFGSDGGHTWVCDGYNSSGLFHMNWGWSGTDNGYFALDDLNPNGIPLGNNQEAIFGIEPIKMGQVNKYDPEVFASEITPVQMVEGIDQVNLPETFNVYPVPSSTVLNVKYSGSLYLISTIVIANALGQTIASYSSVNLSTNYQLDISNYPPGIYFISITSANNNNRKVIRFSKE